MSEPFARKGSRIFAGQFLVHAVHVAYLAAAHAYIAGGYVGIGADVAPQLGDEGLAEAHDFHVGFTLGVEVRPAFSATHGQCGEGVFEGLLEGEELEDRRIDR